MDRHHQSFWKDSSPRYLGGLKRLIPAIPQGSIGVKRLRPASPQGTWGGDMRSSRCMLMMNIPRVAIYAL